MSQITIPTAEGELKITISLGVVTAAKDEMDEQAFIVRADKALYRAKHAGRNCVYAGEADAAAAASAPLRLVNAAG
jgi:diguanylate cyclase (GGDEF)-like protein